MSIRFLFPLTLVCCFLFVSLTVAGQSLLERTVNDSSAASFTTQNLGVDSTLGSTDTLYPPIKWYTFIQNIPRDWSQWTQTAFRQDQINNWALVAGLTTALFVTDDITYTPSKHLFESSERAGYWSNFAAKIGDGRTQFGVAGGFAAYGLVFGDQRALRTGSQIVEVVLGAGAIVQVLKHVTGRESPFTRSSPTGVWKFFPDQIEYHKHVPAYDAFPSGHICTSMATVIVIAENYPEVKWVRPVGYLFCAVIAAGMANNGIHWYSDYPLGILLGYSFGMIASHQELFSVANKSGDDAIRLSVAPTVNQYGAGIAFNVRF